MWGARVLPAEIPACVRHGGAVRMRSQPARDRRRQHLLSPPGMQASEAKMDFLVLHVIGMSMARLSAE